LASLGRFRTIGVIAIVVAACSGILISPDQAANTAKQNMSSSEPIEVLAVRLSDVRTEAPMTEVVPPDTRVWAVTLSGVFQAPSCGPAGSVTCPDPNRTALVLINAQTGEFIIASMPAPPAAIPAGQ
jgi:hypothetical protein